MESVTELQAKLLITLGCKQMLSGKLSETTANKMVYVDDKEEDMISKIIWKRTERYGTKLPIELAYIISIGSGGNPGIAINMYYTFLKTLVDNRGTKLPRDYELTSLDFSISYPDKFPNATTVAGKAFWEDKWDSQKDENGNNKVDMVSYWDELFV